MGRQRRALLCWALLGCAGARPAVVVTEHKPAVPSAPDSFCHRRAVDPPRTIVERPCGTGVAVLTDGARSALLFGAQRRFEEATARHPVVTSAWVRVLPAVFSGTVDAGTTAWLTAALADQSPDLLAMAMQYVDGAPPLFDGQHRQIAGDAAYGPLDGAGQRKEGADFNDYLGTVWTFPDGTVDRPRGEMLRSLDCSGYVRMLWGYRGGLPLARGRVTDGSAIPRRAVQIAASAPGVVIIAPGAAAPADNLDRLQPGDLVFFDADPNDGPAIDHVGMLVGRDTAGHWRFISSRKGANGPTLGDTRGASLLDGTGLYARSFRSARRL
jgi:cell wall-associated NlpC family hydrolase